VKKTHFHQGRNDRLWQKTQWSPYCLTTQHHPPSLPYKRGSRRRYAGKSGGEGGGGVGATAEMNIGLWFNTFRGTDTNTPSNHNYVLPGIHERLTTEKHLRSGTLYVPNVTWHGQNGNKQFRVGLKVYQIYLYHHHHQFAVKKKCLPQYKFCTLTFAR
jgi:hypothetical protein